MRRRPRDSAAIRFYAKLSTALVIVLLFTVWEHVKALNLDKDLQSLRREADRLTYENGRMSMQIHQWESPSHLDGLARQNFGMVPLDAKHVIGLEKR